MFALTSTCRAAVSVSTVLAVQDTSALTRMSPGSAPPGAVSSSTLPRPKLLASVSAPMLEPSFEPPPATTVKSVGSMRQVPCVPASDSVFTRVPVAMCTCAAEVSTRPPRPCSAVASISPDSASAPLAMPPCTVMRPPSMRPAPRACSVPLDSTRSPVIQISPPRSSSASARTKPLLLTSDRATASADAAVSRTVPPSAWIRPLLSTVPAMPASTAAEIRPWPLMLTVAARPAASTTEPASTVRLPRLSTVGASSAR